MLFALIYILSQETVTLYITAVTSSSVNQFSQVLANVH